MTERGRALVTGAAGFIGSHLVSAGQFNGKPRPVVVFDFWRILRDALSTHPEIRYHAAGLSRDDEANAQRLAHLWNGRT